MATLPEGGYKFRANENWMDLNWGSNNFPSGIAAPTPSYIPVPAGQYNINFNSATGVYSFELIPPFSK